MKPLIFDKWTKNAYLAILLNHNEFQKANSFFRGVSGSSQEKIGVARLRSGKRAAEAYHNYVMDMNTWSRDLNVSPAKLEQFLFGNKLNQDSSPSNPRKELWSIILENKNHLI